MWLNKMELSCHVQTMAVRAQTLSIAHIPTVPHHKKMQCHLSYGCESTVLYEGRFNLKQKSIRLNMLGLPNISSIHCPWVLRKENIMKMYHYYVCVFFSPHFFCVQVFFLYPFCLIFLIPTQQTLFFYCSRLWPLSWHCSPGLVGWPPRCYQF